MSDSKIAVKDIMLAELTGTRASNKKIGSARLTARLEVLELEDAPRAIMQRGEFLIVDTSSESDGSDTAEFRAVVTYFVELEEPYTDDQAATLANVMWPYLRSAANDLAARMNVPYVRLPLTLEDSMLDDGAMDDSEVPGAE